MVASMTTVRTMTFSISPQQAKRIEAAVASGGYTSNSEVVRDALRLWELREQLKAAELTKLKDAYAKGIASGKGRTVDAETLLKSFKEKTARRG
jgi:antitoxin ParD1/3/4